MDKIILTAEDGTKYEADVSQLRPVVEKRPFFNCGTVDFATPGDRHESVSLPALSFRTSDEVPTDGFKGVALPEDWDHPDYGTKSFIITHEEAKRLVEKMQAYLADAE